MRYQSIVLACLLLGVAGASARGLMQAGCGAVVPGVTDPPTGALLYLSADAEGTVTYPCINGKVQPGIVDEAASLVNPEGWTGVLFKNPAGAIQMNWGLILEDGSSVNNTIVLGADVTTVPGRSGNLDWARWPVASTEGPAPDAGGLPKMAWANRVETGNGALPKTCKGSEPVIVPFTAVYNLYTCEEAYLGPAAGPSGPIALPPLSGPPLFPSLPILPEAPVPAPTPAPMPEPVPAPELAPVPAPAVAPVPAPIPAPVPIVVPSPPPVQPASSATAVRAALAAAVAVLAMAL